MNKGERTKNYIIEQSSSLFNTIGYKATSISDIMSATGLKKGGIYNHFESKEAIARASLQHLINTLKCKYKEEISLSSTAHGKLNAFFATFSTLATDQIVIGGCPLMNAAIEADDTNFEFDGEVKDGFNGLSGFVQKILEFGIDSGEINKKVNPEQMSIFILASLEGGLALSRLYKEKKYLDTVIMQLNSQLF
ncbi:TetR/AcrR family transcriptional regulator [Cytobacillus gottheilii]|uniref:TetR/AcrR family transcriptional regulator n=1 Tax=Cytobacillus gottheilii TaxID=859144 RepID=UPI0009B9BA16|nr:TetR/AcrR family transcriptional regulator [Cytobacillus gottheilii]